MPSEICSSNFHGQYKYREETIAVHNYIVDRAITDTSSDTKEPDEEYLTRAPILALSWMSSRIMLLLHVNSFYR